MHLTYIAAAVAMAMTAPVMAFGCSVSAQPLFFGTVNPIQQQHVDGTSVIMVDCTTPAAVTISIVSDPSGRRMTGPGVLRYDVFTDAARTHRWGEGSATDDVVSASGTRIRATVYGRMSISRLTLPGTYTDTMTILISW